jgi:hypothetical protein
MKARGWLYRIARGMGDVSAVQKNRVGKRIMRRAAGRVTGRLMGRIFHS